MKTLNCQIRMNYSYLKEAPYNNNITINYIIVIKNEEDVFLLK
jgi:hypothetical protein